MKKYLVILIGVLMMSSCTRNEEHAPATLQDEVVEMNWSLPVKDLYWVEEGGDNIEADPLCYFY